MATKGRTSFSEKDVAVLFDRLRKAVRTNHGIMLDPPSVQRLMALIDMMTIEVMRRKEKKDEGGSADDSEGS